MSGVHDTTSALNKCFEILASESVTSRNRQDEIRERILKGENFRAIAEDYGISFQRVAHIAKAMGINRREVMRARSEDRLRTATQFVDNGYSVRRILELVPDLTIREINALRSREMLKSAERFEVLGLETIMDRVKLGYSIIRACNDDIGIQRHFARYYPEAYAQARRISWGSPASPERVRIIEEGLAQRHTWTQIARDISKLEDRLVNPYQLRNWWCREKRKIHGKTSAKAL